MRKITYKQNIEYNFLEDLFEIKPERGGNLSHIFYVKALYL